MTKQELALEVIAVSYTHLDVYKRQGINNKGSLLKKNDYLYAIKDKAKKILRIESLQKRCV